jgi:exosome complex RNA-binding protein Rrp4
MQWVVGEILKFRKEDWGIDIQGINAPKVSIIP